MAVVGQPVLQYVLDQVGHRQRFYGESVDRSDEFLQYAASRTAWVKFASGVNLTKETHFKASYINETGIKQAQNYVLFNGTSKQKTFKNDDGVPSSGKTYMREGIGFEGSYDTSDEGYGVVPMPGITSVHVKSLNRGSIKEATVKLTCNSQRQFNIIDHLYLRLGYDMLIEWGWSHYITGPNSYSKMGTTLIDFEWFNTNKDGDRGIRYWLKEIESLRKKYNACYGGFFGRVVNFDWSINANGAYDVTVKLITHGDIIESLTIPVSDQNSGGRDIQNTHKYITETIFKDKALRGRCYNDSFFSLTNSEPDPEIASAAFIYDKSSFTNITPGIDQLSQHIANLQFIGRGAENYELYDLTQHLRRTYNNEEIPGVDDEDGDEEDPSGIPPPDNNTLREEFFAQRAIYNKNKIHTSNNYTNKDNYKYVFGRLSIGAITEQRLEPWNKPFRNSGGTANKACGLTFFSSITGNGAANGINYNDAFVLFSKQTVQDNVIKGLEKYNFSSNTYIRFQYILYYLQTYVIAKNKSTGEGVVDINWKLPIFGYVSNPNLTISYNPGRTFVKKEAGFSAGPDDPGIGLNFSNFKATHIPTFGYLQPQGRGMEFDFALNGGVVESIFNVPAFGSGGDVSTMDARHVYFNANYLLEVLNSSTQGDKEKKIDIYSFLKNLCDAINEDFGNINQFEPVIDDSTNELSIIDKVNFSKDKTLFEKIGITYTEPTVEQLLQTYGYRNAEGNTVTNFVRDFQLKSKISKELASMITIGATVKGEIVGTEATAFSRFNKGIINRFQQEYDIPNSSEGPKQTAVDVFNKSVTSVQGTWDFLGINTRTGWNSAEAFYVEPLADLAQKNMSTINDVYQETEAHYYSESTGSGSPIIGFIPFSLELDLDGISGYKIYNKLNTSLSFLPGNYPSTLEFVLSGVDHKLEKNDWVTHLSTIAVPMRGERDLLRDADPTEVDNDVITGSIEVEDDGDTDFEGDTGEGGSDWLELAENEFGVTEKSGDASNVRINDYHKNGGNNSSYRDNTAWCASFVSWVLNNRGYTSTNSAGSRTYRVGYGGDNGLAWSNQKGKDLSLTPSFGCIIALRQDPTPLYTTTSTKGHVGFLIGKSVDESGNITALWIYGGNQANTVCISRYPIPEGGNWRTSDISNHSYPRYFAGFSIPDPAQQTGPLLNYTPKPQGWNYIPTVNSYTKAYKQIGITSGFNTSTGMPTSPIYGAPPGP